MRRACRIGFVIFLVFQGSQRSGFAQHPLPVLIQKIKPSVVTITTYTSSGERLNQGTGFFIRQNQIVTNRHVMADCQRAEVKTSDGNTYEIQGLIAEDRDTDIVMLAVADLSIKAQPLIVTKLPPIEGERIVVIGSPLGLEQSISDGIVSAVRTLPKVGKIIQITAPISPGSSGSPVVNMKGEVVGVATSQLVEGQNLNFAIPAERIAALEVRKLQTLGAWSVDSQMRKYLLNAKRWIEELSEAPPAYAKGLELLEAKNYEEALANFEEAIRLKPDYANAWEMAGDCYVQLNRYKEAVHAYRQSVRLKPEVSRAHFSLGVAYLFIKDRDSALQEYELLRELDVKRANDLLLHVLRDEASEAMDRRNFRLAKLKWEEALKLDPYDIPALIGLGMAYVMEGEYEQGVGFLRQGMRLSDIDKYPRERQSARGMAAVAHGKLWSRTGAKEHRRAAIRFIKEFLADPHPSTFGRDHDANNRDWAKQELEALSNVSGYWIDDYGLPPISGLLMPPLLFRLRDEGFNKTVPVPVDAQRLLGISSYTYRVSFSLVEPKNIGDTILHSVTGFLERDGDTLKGKVTSGRYANVSLGTGTVISYEGDVTLQLSEDFETLSGRIHFHKNQQIVDGKTEILPPFSQQWVLRRKD